MLVLTVPGSKSLTLRHLEAAAFAAGTSRLAGALDAADTRAMAAAAAALGARIEWGETVAVTGTRAAGVPSGPLELDAGESGAVLRCLAAVAARGRGRYRIARHGRLPVRPLQDLVAALAAFGAGVHEGPHGELVVTAAGGPAPERIALAEVRSSQTVSALLLAAPLGREGLALAVPPAFGSAGYVALTVAAMAAHGVPVAREGNVLRVAPGASYRPADVRIAGDWSAGAHLLGAAALAGRPLALAGLDPGSAQPDRAVMGLLAATAVDISCTNSHICISGRPTRPFHLDFDACPDLAPVAAVLAAAIPGRSALTGLGRLAGKESDRLSALARGLRACGAGVEAGAGALRIQGGRLAACRVDGARDHRIVMAFAALGLAVPGLEVGDHGAVAKSFPGFFEQLARIAAPGE